jgi:hypothetical protein
METYTLPQLRKLAKDQDYKRIALENISAERIVPFNAMHASVPKQFDIIQKRLQVQPDGIYTVLMARTIATSNNPERYLMKKGKVQPEALAEAGTKKETVIIQASQSNERMSLDKFMELTERNAELEAENKRLLEENSRLQIEIEEMEADQDEGLQEGSGGVLAGMGGPGGFIKDAISQLAPLADRYFGLQERKLGIEEMRLSRSAQQKTRRVTVKRRPINGNGHAPESEGEPAPGSQQHLDLIERLYNEDKDVEMNRELERLKTANPQVYAVVIQKLDLEEGE